jgi:hypothetical protein
MQIEITDVGPAKKDGNYVKMQLGYVRDGKNNSRTLVAVGKTTEVVKELAANAKPGDIYEIELEKSKDDKFWNWIGATKEEKQVKAEAAKTSYQTKSTYETPEERARKQVYIVRQSSIANAIEFLHCQGKKFSPEEVMDIARAFVSFVFATSGQITVDEVALGGDQDPNANVDFKDDIPF